MADNDYLHKTKENYLNKAARGQANLEHDRNLFLLEISLQLKDLNELLRTLAKDEITITMNKRRIKDEI